MKWLENITGGYSSSAKVVGDSLVLSLPDAISPVVWRMELSEIKAAAFELKQNPEGYVLLMKTPKGEAQEIAPFDNKSRAMKALMAASRAMEQAQSAIRSASGTANAQPAPAKKGGGGQMLAGIIGVLILCGLIFAMVSMGPQMPAVEGGQSMATNTAANNAGSASGVPMSADEFLRAR